MLKYYKYHIKKKKFYYSLVLYFILLTHKILLFIQKNNLIYKKFIFFIINLGIKYLKLNSSNILSIFLKNDINKNIINIFKRDLLLIYFNNFSLISKVFDNDLLSSNIMMISINHHFLNIKYLKNINKYYNLFNNNLIIFSIFFFKLFYILISYKKKLEQVIYINKH